MLWLLGLIAYGNWYKLFLNTSAPHFSQITAPINWKDTKLLCWSCINDSWWQYDTRLMALVIMQYASLMQLLSIAFQFSWSWLLLWEKHYSGFVKVHLNRALSDIKVWCKISPRAAESSFELVVGAGAKEREGQLWCKEGAWVSNMKGRCSCNKTVRLLL